MNNNQENVQNYEEEIDLRELIIVLLKKKIMIISVILVVAIVVGILSKAMLVPVYETNLNIGISMPEIYETRYGEYKLPITLNSEYINLIKSNDIIITTMKDMDYDIEEMTVESLKGNISIEENTESINSKKNSFQVTISAKTSEESLTLAKKLYTNYTEYMDILMKGRAVSYYTNDFKMKIKSLENLLNTTQELLRRNEKLLKNTPETINQKAAMDEIQTNTSEYIVLENIINPNYIKIENDIILNKQTIDTTETSITDYTRYIEELLVEKAAIDTYYELGHEKKLESSIIKVTEVGIFQLSEPVEATSMSNSNSLIRNVLIGGILGGIISVAVALFMAYWKREL